MDVRVMPNPAVNRTLRDKAAKRRVLPRWASLDRGSRMLTAIIRYSLLGLLATGISACAQTAYQRAIVDVPDIDKAVSLTNLLDSRNGQPIPVGVRWFEVLRGTLPVIVTAPHATRPFREGMYRFSDGGGTGGMAAALHSICDVTVVYTTYDSPSDPNFYDDNDFKVTLGQLITDTKPVVLLDIHGSHPYRPYDVDLGTMRGASLLGDTSLLPSLIEVFRNQGILGISVDWFPASKNQTITKYAAARGVPSVQLEFSVTRTRPSADDLAAHRYAQTIQSLSEFLEKRGLCARAKS